MPYAPGASETVSVVPHSCLHSSQFHWRFLLVRDVRGFQVNPLCRHDITRSDRQIGNGGYIRNLDVLMILFCFMPGEILSETSHRHCVINSAISRKKESVHIESSDI